VFVDPVDVHVNRIKIVLRVNQPLPGWLWHSVAKWGYSDLADAGEVWIGGFNIDNDEVHDCPFLQKGLFDSLIGYECRAVL
jgi:hypothetical protein